MENTLKIPDDDEEIISSLELLYNNNNQLSIIEKKFNKLSNIEIDPVIEVILIQYYLVILGGDYNNHGLLEEIKHYIQKLDNNLIKIKKTKNKGLNTSIIIVMEKNKEKASTLYTQINDTYNNYLTKSELEEYSKKYHLFQLHSLQKNTLMMSKELNKNDLNNHLNKLNHYFNELSDIAQTFQDENDIYCKFIDSQISVLEIQIDMLK